MNLMVNPVITDFRQDVNGDIKMLKLGANKEDAWANIAEQGASAKLDNNKTATIDVSTYTEPVVINPTSGKDGMKKATVTLSNIPSGGTDVTFYSWYNEEATPNFYFTLSETPARSDKAYLKDGEYAISTSTPNVVLSYDSENDAISVGNAENPVVYTRYGSTEDMVFTKSW